MKKRKNIIFVHQERTYKIRVVEFNYKTELRLFPLILELFKENIMGISFECKYILTLIFMKINLKNVLENVILFCV